MGSEAQELTFMSLQIRHGAALGLREILSAQVGSAALSAPLIDELSGKV